MSIKVKISPVLQKFTGGREVVEATGNTTGECLNSIEVQFPGIRERIRDGQGQVTAPYDIYVNGEPVYPEELTTPVKDGDEMAIVVFMVGG